MWDSYAGKVYPQGKEGRCCWIEPLWEIYIFVQTLVAVNIPYDCLTVSPVIIVLGTEQHSNQTKCRPRDVEHNPTQYAKPHDSHHCVRKLHMIGNLETEMRACTSNWSLNFAELTVWLKRGISDNHLLLPTSRENRLRSDVAATFS